MSTELNKKIIEVNELTHTYKSDWSFRKTHALKGVSFHISEGEAFGYLGHNGAGKTTTIKSILGLLRFNKGQIYFFGRSIFQQEHRQMIGYVAEQPYFYDYLTVEETLLFYSKLAGVEKSRLSDAVNDALIKVNFPKDRSAKMRTLSKGLTQRVAIAQAIVNNPKLLILDEPFSGLDPVGRKEIRDLFLSLKRQGTSILICSHVLVDVQALCDRAAIINHGEIKKVVDFKDFSTRDDTKFEITCAYSSELMAEVESYSQLLGVDSSKDVISIVVQSRFDGENILAKILSKGLEIYSFNQLENNLEDIFIKVVEGDQRKA
jgi:ABC-2 type transport system ATP-binding protein